MTSGSILAWADGPTFRHAIRVLTVVWSALLTGEAAVRILLIAVLPVDVMIGLSKILDPGPSSTVVLTMDRIRD